MYRNLGFAILLLLCLQCSNVVGNLGPSLTNLRREGPNGPDTLTVAFDLFLDTGVLNRTVGTISIGGEVIDEQITTDPSVDRFTFAVEPATTYTVVIQTEVLYSGSIVTQTVTDTFSTAYGIICSTTTVIRLNQEAVDLLNLATNDIAVVSSDDIQTTEEANMLNSACRPVDGLPTSTLEFRFNVSDCDPEIEQNGDQISYKYTVQRANFYDGSVIQRFESTNCLTFTCVFNTSETVSSDDLQPFIPKETLDADDQFGSFDLEFDFFQSMAYTPGDFLSAPATIEVDQYLFAQILLAGNDPDLVLQTMECWATPTPDSSDSTFYPIIDGGCKADNAYDEADSIVVTENFRPFRTRFQFRAYTWGNIAFQEIYVHCTVTICNLAEDSSCDADPCDKRKRRDVSTNSGNQVSYGPILLREESEEAKDLCAINNGGCDDMCVMKLGKPVCSCEGGKFLGEDRKSCIDIELLRNNGDSQEMFSLLLLVLFALGNMLAILVWQVTCKK